MFHIITTNRDGTTHVMELADEPALHNHLVECFKYSLQVPDNVKIFRVQEIKACLKTVMTLSDIKTS